MINHTDKTEKLIVYIWCCSSTCTGNKDVNSKNMVQIKLFWGENIL